MSQTDKKYIRSSKNCFSSNCSYWQVESSFDAPPKIFRQKAKNICLNVRYWIEITLFSENIVFLKLFLWTRKMQFWQPLRRIVEKMGRRVFAQVPQMLKKHSYLKNMFFLKLFLRICGMQFSQPFGEIGEKRPNRYCSSSAKVKET